MKWQDKTGYSQRDKERIPRIWEIKLDHVDVVVHRIIHLDGWFVSSKYMGFSDISLKQENIEQAKVEAFNYVAEQIKMKQKELSSALLKIYDLTI